MAKKRKTRTQKMSADRRHSMTSPRIATSPIAPPQAQETPSQRTYSFSQAAIPESQPAHAIAVAHYGYLVKDLRKTALVTVAIIVAELVLAMTVLR